MAHQQEDDHQDALFCCGMLPFRRDVHTVWWKLCLSEQQAVLANVSFPSQVASLMCAARSSASEAQAINLHG